MWNKRKEQKEAQKNWELSFYHFLTLGQIQLAPKKRSSIQIFKIPKAEPSFVLRDAFEPLKISMSLSS